MSAQSPLVSCIMPTFNRREFVPHAIQYFLRQDYENKELIVIDDGSDSIRDLIPTQSNIQYYYLPQKMSIGAKLNLACRSASGDIIANWNDDDWYSSGRLKYQVDSLLQTRTAVCGINTLLYFDLRKKQAYQYAYPSHLAIWLAGSSLCYTKELWNRNNFADTDIGEDGLFIWNISSEQIKVLSDSSMSVHMIHNKNVCPKKTDGGWWQEIDVENIERILENDWLFYRDGSFAIL